VSQPIEMFVYFSMCQDAPTSVSMSFFRKK